VPIAESNIGRTGRDFNRFRIIFVFFIPALVEKDITMTAFVLFIS